MNVGMANAAKNDVEQYIMGAGFTPLNGQGANRRGGGLCAVGFGGKHDVSFFVFECVP
jgi:hypothetical protein